MFYPTNLRCDILQGTVNVLQMFDVISQLEQTQPPLVIALNGRNQGNNASGLLTA